MLLESLFLPLQDPYIFQSYEPASSSLPLDNSVDIFCSNQLFLLSLLEKAMANKKRVR